MRVLIIQGQMKAYRQPFFEQLYSELASHGVDLYVVYGRPSVTEASKSDNVDLPSEFSARIRNFWILSDKVLYQSVWNEVFKSDMVIVEHANKHIINYLLMVASTCGLKKLAFWGHGKNLQGNSLSISERFKKHTIGCSNWWFAYTKGTKSYLKERGVPENHITVVQNSIDTKSLRKEISTITVNESNKFLIDVLGFPSDAQVAIYCGGLYEKKCLPFLIKSGNKLYSENPQFRLLIVGDGAMKNYIQNSEESEPWLRYVGAAFGLDKAKCFSVASVFLCPGLIGLAILDAFAAGLPVITTKIDWHSPEIEYLEDGVNGVMLPHCEKAYVEGVSKILSDPSLYDKLACGAIASGDKYTMMNMVNNFSRGIQCCLKSM